MDAKTLRKQIRNVLQETANDILVTEVGEKVKSELLADMNARLDQIDKYCQSSLEKQNKRAQAIQSFVIGEVTGKIQSDLFNANCTIDAVVAVLAESGINIEDFSKKVDEKKVIIAKEAQEKASAEMAAEMARRTEEAKAHAAAQQQPVTEESSPAQQS